MFLQDYRHFPPALQTHVAQVGWRGDKSNTGVSVSVSDFPTHIQFMVGHSW